MPDYLAVLFSLTFHEPRAFCLVRSLRLTLSARAVLLDVRLRVAAKLKLLHRSVQHVPIPGTGKKQSSGTGGNEGHKEPHVNAATSSGSYAS